MRNKLNMCSIYVYIYVDIHNQHHQQMCECIENSTKKILKAITSILQFVYSKCTLYHEPLILFYPLMKKFNTIYQITQFPFSFPLLPSIRHTHVIAMLDFCFFILGVSYGIQKSKTRGHRRNLLHIKNKSSKIPNKGKKLKQRSVFFFSFNRGSQVSFRLSNTA